MPKTFFFTIHLLIKSDTNLTGSIRSILDNENFFREHIQLVLIDTIGSELSMSVCTKYTADYPENVYFVDAAGQSPAESYNDASPIAAGVYSAFIDNYCSYSPGALPLVMDMTRSGKIPVFCIQTLQSSAGSGLVPYVNDMESGIIRLHDSPDKAILLLNGYFFNRKIAFRQSFDTHLSFHCDAKYIIEALLTTYTYVYSDRCSIITLSPTEKSGEKYPAQYAVGFYTEAVKSFILPMLHSSHDSIMVQSAMMYLIESKFALNTDELYHNVITGSKVRDFTEAVADALYYIDDTVILNKRLCRLCGLDAEMPFRFLRMKYKNPGLKPEVDAVLPGKSLHRTYYIAPNRREAMTLSGELAAHYQNVLITDSRQIKIEIHCINYDSEGLYMDAVLMGCSCLNEKDYSLHAVLNGKRFPVQSSPVYTLRKYFGQSFLRRFAFRLFLPLEQSNKLDTIGIYFRWGKLAFRPQLLFEGIYAGLNNNVKGSFLNLGSKILSYDPKSRSLVLRRSTESLAAVLESRFTGTAAGTMPVTEYITMRRIRSIAKRIKRSKGSKRILIFYEEKGINYNGNLLFRYFYRHRTEAFEPYICIRHNSPEAAFLRDAGYDNVLEMGSAKAKAYILSADFLFCSNSDPYTSLGFTKNDCIYFRDLVSAANIAVKNRFITYHSAQTDNRVQDNIQFVFCSSQQEKKQLSSPVYDYDPEMICVTGTPILDAAVNKQEKLILLVPSHRRVFQAYEYSSEHRFADSSFFKAYHSLISDTGLLQLCREKKWRIALILPKELDQYAALFQPNEVVTVTMAAEQTLSTMSAKAAVLVTDYSDLQYRFAYMQKPVIYFFPGGMPLNSEHEGEGISRNGFGEILFDNDALCKALTEGIQNGFAVPEKYRQREDSFFLYRDKGNCKRIYEKILEWL